MLHIFKKRYPQAKSSSGGGNDVLINMDFAEKKDDAKPTGKGTDAKGS